MSSILTSEPPLQDKALSGGLTAEAAAQLLQRSPDAYATPQALMSLVAQVSVAHADGLPTDRTVLYSGDIDEGPPPLGSWKLATALQGQDPGVLIIDVTERGRFLSSEAFQDAMLRAFAKEGFETYADITKARDSEANKFLFDAEDGAWAKASRSFAESLEGDVVVLSSKANPARTFGLVELPALLANPKVNSVNVIAKNTLAQLAGQPNGQAVVFKALAETAKSLLNQCAVAWDENQRIAHVDTTPLIGRCAQAPKQGAGQARLIQAGEPDPKTLDGLNKAVRLVRRKWLEQVLGVRFER